jgi:hypothetical protein
MPEYKVRRISHPEACQNCRFGGVAQIVFRLPEDIDGPQIRAVTQVACSRADCDFHMKGMIFPPQTEILSSVLLVTNSPGFKDPEA